MHLLDAAADHIVGVQAVLAERQPGDIVDHDRLGRGAELHLAGMIDVAEHPVFGKLDAPGRQEPLDAGVLLAALDAGKPARRGVGLRVDEDQGLAALHDELVDGVERLVCEADRLDDHQEVDVFRDLFHVRHKRLNLEHLLDLGQHLPFGQLLALLRLTAGNRQGRS